MTSVKVAGSLTIQYGRGVRSDEASTGEGHQDRWRWLAVLAIAFLALTSPGLAHADPLLTPTGFRLAATNGYSLSVLAGQNRETGAGFVLLLVRSPRAQVFYGSPASVTATSIEARPRSRRADRR